MEHPSQCNPAWVYPDPDDGKYVIATEAMTLDQIQTSANIKS
jgi:hypothetical protein